MVWLCFCFWDTWLSHCLSLVLDGEHGCAYGGARSLSRQVAKSGQVRSWWSFPPQERASWHPEQPRDIQGIRCHCQRYSLQLGSKLYAKLYVSWSSRQGRVQVPRKWRGASRSTRCKPLQARCKPFKLLLLIFVRWWRINSVQYKIRRHRRNHRTASGITWNKSQYWYKLIDTCETK